MKKIWVITLILGLIWACKKGNDIIEEEELFVGFVQPSNFPKPAYDLSRNPVTKDGFELGKKLFYEPRLSRNNTIACGSCHIQGAGFTHHGHDVSHGIDDRLGTRNPMPIMNLAWHSEFFWDGGVFDLDFSPANAIHSEVEMDETVPNVLLKLRARPEYTAMFKKLLVRRKLPMCYFLEHYRSLCLWRQVVTPNMIKSCGKKMERHLAIRKHADTYSSRITVQTVTRSLCSRI